MARMLALGTARKSIDNTSENLNPDGRSFLSFICDSLAVLWKDWPKNMKLNVLDASQLRYSLSGKCPHCYLPSVFIRVADPYQREVGYLQHLLVSVMECQGCQQFILGIVGIERDNWEYLTHYPLGTPNDSVDPAVPVSIAADFSEALRCFFIQSYKATVAMCRRCVEASSKDLGAKGANLKERIDDLAIQGKITQPLREMAHKVRLTANEQLHGKPDDLDSFTEPEAAGIIEFVEQYFLHVYVMPEKLANFGKPKAPLE